MWAFIKTTTTCALPACTHINKHHCVWLISPLGLDQNIRIFVRWVGIRFWDSNILIIIFVHLASPAKLFSACLPGWTSAPADRSPMKDVRADLYHACISWKIFYYARACHTSTFEIMNLSVEKMRHVNGTLCYHKTDGEACVFFLSTVPKCERKSWFHDVLLYRIK